MGVRSILKPRRRAQLRLAVVGCGDIASFSAWFMRLNRGIRLAACCDIDLDRANRFAKRHKIQQVFSDYGRLLDEVHIDAVYLAIPHNLHYAMMEAAIQSGVHIFVEKPITRTLSEGIAITKMAQDSQIKIGVNYQYRYDSGCYALARAVQRGDLGEIHLARLNVPWRRKAGYFEQAAWHKSYAQAGGGTLITQGSHMLDIVLWALGFSPLSAIGATRRRVFTDIEVEDLAQGTIEMENGALIQVNSTMVANPERAVSIEVYGQNGTAIYKNKPRPHVRFSGFRARKERPPHRAVHALQRSIEGMRAWIVDGRPYLTPAAEALPVLAAVEAIYRSAESGCREMLDAYRI